MTDITRPDSLGIAVPKEWLELPVERSRFDEFTSAIRRRWIDNGWDRTTQRQGELLLGRMRRDLLNNGVQFVAMYLDDPKDEYAQAAVPIPGEPSSEEEQAIVMATCTLGTYTKAMLGATANLTVGNLLMSLSRKTDRDGTDPEGPKYKRIVDVQPPAVHRMPIGRSVRLRRLYELLSPGALPQRFYGETFLTPIGDDGNECVITHFTTLNLGLSGLFSELFAKIAQTITVWSPDDETSFESDWVDALGDD